jgi:RNA polymerase sigma-70 factor (ECF subfamily)
MEREIELQLVARLKTGDGDAFEAVYNVFHPRLFGFLARLSHRRDVAEDLLEETWLRLVTHARDLADDTCLAAWLFTVARNLYASWRRNRALDWERISELTPSWPAPSQSPFEGAACSETKRRLESALARLPLQHREVLLLVAVEGLTPLAAAEVIGVAPEALRKWLQRAREPLVEEMETETAARQADSHTAKSQRIWRSSRS